jgi:hypothetical protein
MQKIDPNRNRIDPSQTKINAGRGNFLITLIINY